MKEKRNRINREKNGLLLPGILLLVLMVFLWAGCGKKHIPTGPLPPAGTVKDQGKVKVPPVSGIPSAPKQTTVEVLTAKGNQLAAVGDYRAALATYNRALSRALPTDRSALMAVIEPVVLRSDVTLLREIMARPDNHIPQPLLLYGIGYQYAARGENDLSREALTDFIERYPRHPRAGDARELMEILGVEKKDAGVKIGCLLPLSGKYAVFGNRALKGIQVALSRLSQRYGDGITLIVRDTASDNGVARERMQELIDARVLAVAGPMVTARSVSGLAQAHGIPMIAMTQREDVSQRGDYVFSNFITPAMQVRSLVSHAMIHQGVRTFGVLYPRDKYGMRLMKLFSDTVVEMGGEVKRAVVYDGGQSDFSRQIKAVAGFDDPALQARLRKERDLVRPRDDAHKNAEDEASPIVGIEALFIPDAPSRLALLLPQLAYHDVTDIQLLGPNIWYHPSLIRHAGDYVKNALITEGYFPESHRAAAMAFKDTFTAMFEETPHFIEAIAHDTVSILVEAAMDSGVDSRKSLKNLLTGRRIFEGATGKTLFDKEGGVHKELFFLTVKKGAFVEITH